MGGLSPASNIAHHDCSLLTERTHLWRTPAAHSGLSTDSTMRSMATADSTRHPRCPCEGYCSIALFLLGLKDVARRSIMEQQNNTEQMQSLPTSMVFGKGMRCCWHGEQSRLAACQRAKGYSSDTVPQRARHVQWPPRQAFSPLGFHVFCFKYWPDSCSSIMRSPGARISPCFSLVRPLHGKSCQRRLVQCTGEQGCSGRKRCKWSKCGLRGLGDLDSRPV